MKTLKYTAIALLLFGSLTACVNEELDFKTLKYTAIAQPLQILSKQVHQPFYYSDP
ncbi:hypothetical protein [Formosa sp. 4Alg 33]|uniref:hypothetical protein n=1 Tax=Formosa sp. 4Alg 33 TaxID=3382189 RepID=UPI003D9C2B9B